MVECIYVTQTDDIMNNSWSLVCAWRRTKIVSNGVFAFSLLTFGSKHILAEAYSQSYTCILSMNFFSLRSV